MATSGGQNGQWNFFINASAALATLKNISQHVTNLNNVGQAASNTLNKTSQAVNNMTQQIAGAGVHTTRLKARVHQNTAAANGFGNALGNTTNASNKANTSLQRLGFRLGLVRFQYNIAAFAAASFLGILQVDKIANYDQAVNQARTTLMGMGLTADEANERIAALQAGVGDRKDILAQLLGDPDTVRKLQGMTPTLVKQLGELAVQAKDLEGRDPKVFFNALADVLLHGSMPGAIQALASLTGHGEKLLEIFGQPEGAANVVKFFQDAFGKDTRTAAIETQMSITEIIKSWDTFVNSFLTTLGPVIKSTLELFNIFMKDLSAVLNPTEGQAGRNVMITAAILGGAIGFAIITGGGTGLLGVVGGIAGFMIIKRLLDDATPEILITAGILGTAIGLSIISGGYKNGVGLIGGIASFGIIAKIMHELYSGDGENATIHDKVLDNVAMGLGLAIGLKVGKGVGVGLALILPKIIAEGLKTLRDNLRAGLGMGELNEPDLPEWANPTVRGFATGGVVPGPIGSPSLAMVHGGEIITNPHNSSGMGGVGNTIQVILDKRILGEFVIDAFGKFARHRAGIVPGRIG